MPLLPIPFREYVTSLLKNNVDNDPGGLALVTKADTHIEEWAGESLELYYLKWPERCPSRLLPNLGNYLSAGLDSFDTDREKRIKIANAVAGHKTRTLWEEDAKIIVDAVAGGDSSLVKNYFGAEWILWAGESDDPTDYSTTLGDDSIDNDLGIDLLGNFDECNIAGIVWIDVDNDSLTADEVNRLVTSMDRYVVPSYFKVVLGYIDGVTGFFMPYANGTMG